MSIKKSIDNINCYKTEAGEKIIIYGWCFDTDEEKTDYIVKINDKKVDFTLKIQSRKDVRLVYKDLKNSLNSGFEISIIVEEDVEISKLELYVKNGSKQKKIYSIGKNKLTKKAKKTLNYNIDNIGLAGEIIIISGWAVSKNTCDNIEFLVEDNDRNTVLIHNKQLMRKDVYENLEPNESYLYSGFHVRFKYNKKLKYKFTIKDSSDLVTISINPNKLGKSKLNLKVIHLLFSNMSLQNIIKGIGYLLQYGPKKFKIKIMDSIHNKELPYEEWFEINKCSSDELQLQREEIFSYEPKISIIVPTYKTPESFLKEMITSVINQSYSNWELCIADGSVEDKTVENILKEYCKTEHRIRYKILNENLGISENTNAALSLVTGDYIALLDHDDLLAPNALYEVVSALNKDPDVDVIYTDEDKISMDSVIHFQPHFKPDFSIDLLRSNNYICHFFIVSKKIVSQIKGFRKEFDGSQDYDFIFRCTEQAKRIYHIPKILYYWRMHQNSVAENPESKMYAFDAGKRAIEENLKRMGAKAQVHHTGHLGFYRVKYDIIGTPLVSIIIPNRDHCDVLKVCIDSIINKSTYKNYEIVIVENNSVQPDTFEYYKEIEKKDKIKILYWNDEFNYSLINNFGVSNSNGEYIILLNNDTEIITDEWIEEFLGNCQRPDVGIVGAKLYYPDDTVQHAGVILGLGGVAGHAFTGLSREEQGYFCKTSLQLDVSAVTAACLMVKRNVFEEVHGFEGELKVAFNDVDFCIKVREAGYLIVFNPYIELYHYESKSRGSEDTLEKVLRFEGEVNYMKNKWGTKLTRDPYYNPNLSLLPPGYLLKPINENL